MKNFHKLSSKLKSKLCCKLGLGRKKKKSGSHPVYLNVYDLTSMNGYTYWLGLGVYHSGVEVHGIEYSFAPHSWRSTGIFKEQPKQFIGDPFQEYTLRKSILIGKTNLDPKEVKSFMKKLGEEYPGIGYNLLAKNCNHFCNDVCIRMTGKPIPRWVNRLARIAVILPMDMLPIQVQEARIQHRLREAKANKLRRQSSGSFFSCSPRSSTDTARLQHSYSRQRSSSLSLSPSCLVGSSFLDGLRD